MLSSTKYLYFLFCGNINDTESLEYEQANRIATFSQANIAKQLANGYDEANISYTEKELDALASQYHDILTTSANFYISNFEDGQVLLYSNANIASPFYYAEKGKLFESSNGVVKEIKYSDLANIIKQDFFFKSTKNGKQMLTFNTRMFSVKMDKIRVKIAHSTMEPVWED